MLMAKRAAFAQSFGNFFRFFFRRKSPPATKEKRGGGGGRIAKRRQNGGSKGDKRGAMRRERGRLSVGVAWSSGRFGRKKTLGDFSSSVSALPC